MCLIATNGVRVTRVDQTRESRTYGSQYHSVYIKYNIPFHRLLILGRLPLAIFLFLVAPGDKNQKIFHPSMLADFGMLSAHSGCRNGAFSPIPKTNEIRKGVNGMCYVWSQNACYVRLRVCVCPSAYVKRKYCFFFTFHSILSDWRTVLRFSLARAMAGMTMCPWRTPSGQVMMRIWYAFRWRILFSVSCPRKWINLDRFVARPLCPMCCWLLSHWNEILYTFVCVHIWII